LVAVVVKSSPDRSVLSAVLADLERLGGDLAESSEAAAALALARQLDDASSGATAKSMCAKALADLMAGLRERRPWSAFEAAVNVARQNGKNEIALVRELAGLFLFGERLIIHSAHEFKTSTEHQRRVEETIHDNPDLLRQTGQ
jgi:hypothetical protein